MLVRTQALAVNFVDALVRSGRYPTPKAFPFVIGRDLVGVVAAVGDAVHGFHAGDAVPYCTPPALRTWRCSAEGGLRFGDIVLVSGAAGSVGTTAVQFAAACGAHVIATAREEDAEWCRSAGAETVLDYRDPDLWRHVYAAAPAGIDVFFETSRHYDFAQTLPLLALGGRFILITSMGSPVQVLLDQLYLRDANLRGFTISAASVADLAEVARAINDGISRGLLRVRIAARLSLAESSQSAPPHRGRCARPDRRSSVAPGSGS